MGNWDYDPTSRGNPVTPFVTGRNPHEVEQLNATSRAFSAIMADGKIVAWGSPEHGAMAVEFWAKMMWIFRGQQISGCLKLKQKDIE